MCLLRALCCLAALLSSSSVIMAQSHVFFTDGIKLYRASMDSGKTLVEEWFQPESYVEDMITSVDGTTVFLFVGRPGDKDALSFVRVSTCDRNEVVMQELHGISSCSVEGLSSDGRTAVIIAKGSSVAKGNDVLYTTLSLQSLALGSSFPSDGIWCIDNNRIAYWASDRPSRLLSRGINGNDQRLEANLNTLLKGKTATNSVFSQDGKLYILLSNRDACELYRIDSPDDTKPVLTVSGTYLGVSTDHHLFYRGPNGKDLCCVSLSETPSQDTHFLADLSSPGIGLETKDLRRVYSSSDGKKLFFLRDRGQQEPLKVCFYDADLKVWSTPATSSHGSINAVSVVTHDCSRARTIGRSGADCNLGK